MDQLPLEETFEPSQFTNQIPEENRHQKNDYFDDILCPLLPDQPSNYSMEDEQALIVQDSSIIGIIQIADSPPSMFLQNQGSPSTNIISEQNQPVKDQISIKHYSKNRRKKKDRVSLNKLMRLAARYDQEKYIIEKGQATQKLVKRQRPILKLKPIFRKGNTPKNLGLGDITKDLLSFASNYHLDYIKNALKQRYIKNAEYFQCSKLLNNRLISLDDYDRIYKQPQFKQILSQFFRKKVLYRELMLSRAIRRNKLFYLCFLQVFERNFKKGQFKSITLSKLQLQSQKISSGVRRV